MSIAHLADEKINVCVKNIGFSICVNNVENSDTVHL